MNKKTLKTTLLGLGGVGAVAIGASASFVVSCSTTTNNSDQNQTTDNFLVNIQTVAFDNNLLQKYYGSVANGQDAEIFVQKYLPEIDLKFLSDATKNTLITATNQLQLSGNDSIVYKWKKVKNEQDPSKKFNRLSIKGDIMIASVNSDGSTTFVPITSRFPNAPAETNEIFLPFQFLSQSSIESGNAAADILSKLSPNYTFIKEGIGSNYADGVGIYSSLVINGKIYKSNIADPLTKYNLSLAQLPSEWVRNFDLFIKTFREYNAETQSLAPTITSDEINQLKSAFVLKYIYNIENNQAYAGYANYGLFSLVSVTPNNNDGTANFKIKYKYGTLDAEVIEVDFETVRNFLSSSDTSNYQGYVDSLKFNAQSIANIERILPSYYLISSNFIQSTASGEWTVSTGIVEQLTKIINTTGIPSSQPYQFVQSNENNQTNVIYVANAKDDIIVNDDNGSFGVKLTFSFASPKTEVAGTIPASVVASNPIIITGFSSLEALNKSANDGTGFSIFNSNEVVSNKSVFSVLDNTSKPLINVSSTNDQMFGKVASAEGKKFIDTNVVINNPNFKPTINNSQDALYTFVPVAESVDTSTQTFDWDKIDITKLSVNLKYAPSYYSFTGEATPGKFLPASNNGVYKVPLVSKVTRTGFGTDFISNVADLNTLISKYTILNSNGLIPFIQAGDASLVQNKPNDTEGKWVIFGDTEEQLIINPNVKFNLETLIKFISPVYKNNGYTADAKLTNDKTKQVINLFPTEVVNELTKLQHFLPKTADLPLYNLSAESMKSTNWEALSLELANNGGNMYKAQKDPTWANLTYGDANIVNGAGAFYAVEPTTDNDLFGLKITLKVVLANGQIVTASANLDTNFVENSNVLRPSIIRSLFNEIDTNISLSSSNAIIYKSKGTQLAPGTNLKVNETSKIAFDLSSVLLSSVGLEPKVTGGFSALTDEEKLSFYANNLLSVDTVFNSIIGKLGLSANGQKVNISINGGVQAGSITLVKPNIKSVNAPASLVIDLSPTWVDGQAQFNLSTLLPNGYYINSADNAGKTANLLTALLLKRLLNLGDQGFIGNAILDKLFKDKNIQIKLTPDTKSASMIIEVRAATLTKKIVASGFSGLTDSTVASLNSSLNAKPQTVSRDPAESTTINWTPAALLVRKMLVGSGEHDTGWESKFNNDGTLKTDVVLSMEQLKALFVTNDGWKNYFDVNSLFAQTLATLARNGTLLYAPVANIDSPENITYSYTNGYIQGFNNISKFLTNNPEFKKNIKLNNLWFSGLANEDILGVIPNSLTSDVVKAKIEIINNETIKLTFLLFTNSLTNDNTSNQATFKLSFNFVASSSTYSVEAPKTKADQFKAAVNAKNELATVTKEEFVQLVKNVTFPQHSNKYSRNNDFTTFWNSYLVKIFPKLKANMFNGIQAVYNSEGNVVLTLVPVVNYLINGSSSYQFVIPANLFKGAAEGTTINLGSYVSELDSSLLASMTYVQFVDLANRANSNSEEIKNFLVKYLRSDASSNATITTNATAFDSIAAVVNGTNIELSLTVKGNYNFSSADKTQALTLQIPISNFATDIAININAFTSLSSALSTKTAAEWNQFIKDNQSTLSTIITTMFPEYTKFTNTITKIVNSSLTNGLWDNANIQSITSELSADNNLSLTITFKNTAKVLVNGTKVLTISISSFLMKAPGSNI